jgi:hypothetical protein
VGKKEKKRKEKKSPDPNHYTPLINVGSTFFTHNWFQITANRVIVAYMVDQAKLYTQLDA